MRKIYSTYPVIGQLSNMLSWSHYIELLKLEDDLERSFYEKECESEHWGVRELKRQMKSMLFHRIALSSDKNEVLRLAKEGQVRLNTETGSVIARVYWLSATQVGAETRVNSSTSEFFVFDLETGQEIEHYIEDQKT